MKNMIETFSALGARLLGFGDDDATRAVIDSACRANGWFTPADIRRAVRAIACDMLQREKLEAWLADYPALPVAEPRRVLVVMAGNIPLVGFFDLLCVLVSGHGCLVKPSAKDSVLMEHVVGLLREIDPSAPVRLYDGTSPVDAVIATGSDNANRYFRAHYAGIPSLLRGSRQSVAVLSGRETPEQLAFLRAVGCELIQGCIYAKPLPVPAFEAWRAARGQNAGADLSRNERIDSGPKQELQ